MIAPYIREIAAPFLPLTLASTDPGVSRVQEWLGLQGFATGIDGDFGPATKRAISEFQSANQLPATGTVDKETWDVLASPLIEDAMRPVPIDGMFGDTVVRIATEHLEARAREIGGDNRGPWVRHYCRGLSVAWCQGFASTIWCSAARMRSIDTPIELGDSLYVPWVVNSARQAGRYRSGSDTARMAAGSFFFVPGGDAGYLHVGIVVHDDGTTIKTIEGNSNTDGSSNGYEVVQRYRRKSTCDYGLA